MAAQHEGWDGGRVGKFGCREEEFWYEERDRGVARCCGGGGGHGDCSD